MLERALTNLDLEVLLWETEMAYTAMASLLNKLTGKLLEEGDLFQEVEDRVWSLLCMLKKVRPFVMEVQRNESAELMKEFIELVHEADDAIDSYITTTTTVRRLAENISGGRPKDKDADLKAGDELRSQIELIKSMLEIWHKRSLNSTASSTSSSSVVVEDDKDDMVVGLENEVTMMIERLIKDKNPRRDVIPIVGPGGVGKTTLARSVYNHPTIVKKFPCRAWIYAYNVYYGLPMKMLLQEIINQVSHHGAEAEAEAEAKDNTELAIQTYMKLKKCDRYLLVIDDVCRTQFWDAINMIFPCNKRGGRIIFTTRYGEVALYATPRRSPFYLQSSLNKEKSWTLFTKRVASGSSSGDNASTSSGGPLVDHHPWKEWVDACGGLPLAIVALAEEHQRLKSSPPVDEQWDKRLPEGIWELIYNNLPYHLKPCLHYLGVFNSCCATQFKELIIAEDLVQSPRTTIRSRFTEAEAEDYDIIAQNYLSELISRNLVEVVRKRWNRGIKDIAIRKQLQLMDFCRNKAREENFLEIIEDPQNFPQEANRIAIQGWDRDHFCASPMKARSLLILKQGEKFPSERIFDQHWGSLLQNYSSLRVLDLCVVLQLPIPSEIERLIHLRYLRLNYKDFEGTILPPSICNLWNLQFLRLKNYGSWSGSSGIPLPMFWRMRRLKRLLYNGGALHVPQPPKDLIGGGGGGDGGGSVLNNLQRLKYVSVLSCTKDVFSRMPNLVRLSVGGLIEQKHIDELSQSLPSLKNLQKLGLRGGAWNKTKSLPRWDMFPPNITHLTLNQTRLVGDPMRILGKLPKLEVLKLAFNAIDGNDLNVAGVTTDGEGLFRHLKCFKLEELDIKRWNLTVGAMPSLEILVIKNCSSLTGLPSEALQKISSLQELELYNCSSKAVENAALGIQERVGRDRLQLRFLPRLSNHE